MIRRIRLFLVVVMLVVIQTTVFPHLRVFGAMPDLLLLATIAVAYEDGPDTGAIFGFFSGLAIDLFLETPLGVSALTFAIIGYLVGVFQGGMLRPSGWVAPVLGGVGGLAGGAAVRRDGLDRGRGQPPQRPQPEDHRGLGRGLRRPAGPDHLPDRPLGRRRLGLPAPRTAAPA